MIFYVILGVLTALFGAAMMVFIRKKRLAEEKVIKMDNTISDLKWLIEKEEEAKGRLEVQIESLKGTIESLKGTIEVLRVEKIAAENAITALQAVDGRDADAAERIEWMKKTLDGLNATYDEKVSALAALNEELRGVDERLSAGKTELGKVVSELGKTRDDLTNTYAALEVAKEAYRTSVTILNGVDEKGVQIALDEVERGKVARLNDIIAFAPDWKDDLLKLAWSRIWLGKMQDVVKEADVNGVCGIYRLIRISDGAVYIGQAKDIKERWYQHAKKMVGVEKVGNEKLYKGGVLPSDWWWGVVERDVPTDKLDARERYWIEWYQGTGSLNIK